MAKQYRRYTRRQIIQTAAGAAVFVILPCRSWCRASSEEGFVHWAFLSDTHIPEIDPVPLPENGLCCGGSGGYLLAKPQGADALREDKLEALRRCGVELLVTTNAGCALHLRAGIREAGLAVEVLHPLELLLRQSGMDPEVGAASR